MRKVSSIFMVGLCVGAVAALVVTGRDTSVADKPRPIATTQGIVTTTPEPPATKAAAGKPDPTAAPAPEPKPSVSARGKIDPGTLDALVPGGKLSAVVFDRASGAITVSRNPDRVYTSASLVKLFIALEVLGREGPAADVQHMLSRSDDDLASQFWVAYGGPAIVTHWARTIGLQATKPPAAPGRWGDTEITAADMVRVYRYLLDSAPASARNIILSALAAATERGSDNFRQYFGIPDGLGDSQPWAIKQGWACCRPTRVLHTSGVIGKNNRYIVVVLTENPRSVSDGTGSKEVTAVVNALRPTLGGS